jgi:hypothetical protein
MAKQIKQIITVELLLDPGQEPYYFNEAKVGGINYIALEEFFKGVGFVVLSYGSKIETK